MLLLASGQYFAASHRVNFGINLNVCVVVMRDRISIANESNLNVCVYRFDCHRNYNLIDKSISNNDGD